MPRFERGSREFESLQGCQEEKMLVPFYTIVVLTLFFGSIAVMVVNTVYGFVKDEEQSKVRKWITGMSIVAFLWSIVMALPFLFIFMFASH